MKTIMEFLDDIWTHIKQFLFKDKIRVEAEKNFLNVLYHIKYNSFLTLPYLTIGQKFIRHIEFNELSNQFIYSYTSYIPGDYYFIGKNKFLHLSFETLETLEYVENGVTENRTQI